MAFLFGETTLSKEPRKVAAETLMPEAAGKSPLLQSEARPGRGEFSFYARKVVPPVDAEELPKLLEAHSEIWLVGENVPVPEYASATVVKQVGELQLVRLSTKWGEASPFRWALIHSCRAQPCAGSQSMKKKAFSVVELII